MKTSLKKRIITKHDVHQCKECDEKLPTFMNLLKHIAKNHYEDQSEGEKRHSEDDAILDEVEAAFKINKQGDHRKDIEEDRDSSFVFKESMLDEFL